MTPTRPRLKPPQVERFPIHVTCPGPNYGDDAQVVFKDGRCKKYFTQNPIPEDTQFDVLYGDYIVRLRLDHHFYCDEKVSIVHLVSVTKTGVKKC